jgi:hypothetical protein
MTLANRKHNTRLTAAALPPASCVVSALLILTISPAVATTECRAHKDRDGTYWSWREIEHRRCWYRGQRGMTKRALYWPGMTASAKRQSADPPSPRPPDVAADASAVLNTIGDRWPEADWTETSRRLFEEAAAVTATAPLRRVPKADASANAILDRRHQPSNATPKMDAVQDRSPGLALAMLMIGLGMIGAGAFVIRMRT